ncbi:hypothetical protein GCM10010502_58360 [Kitasatospora aureofaciens]|uniref:Uncharacterized protein n=1 Tax=Kitasatospora aureofaciens TaxID=1894 RepID=A0A8H9LWU3_KITAU|nr:hypothetical protein GCM10010502_58360 [Kitasatospora aureofaciens]
MTTIRRAVSTSSRSESSLISLYALPVVRVRRGRARPPCPKSTRSAQVTPTGFHRLDPARSRARHNQYVNPDGWYGP